MSVPNSDTDKVRRHYLNRHIMADWVVTQLEKKTSITSLNIFKQYIVQWTKTKIRSNTKMSPASSELSGLQLCYFTKINCLETDVMFHKTAVAE